MPSNKLNYYLSNSKTYSWTRWRPLRMNWSDIGNKLLTTQKATFLQKNGTTFNLVSIIIGSTLLEFLMCRCCKINPFKLFNRTPGTHRNGCIQIFNNCFDHSRRRQHVEIPMRSLNITTTCIETSDEDDVEVEEPPTHPQRSTNKGQSLF